MTTHSVLSLHTGRKTAAYALTVGLATMIFILAMIPLPTAPSIPGADKTHHFIAFAALVLPAAVLYPSALWWVLPFAVLEAGTIEIVQPYANRMREWADFTAGLKGALAGVVAGITLHYIMRAAMMKTASNRSQNRP